jgi:hypothetical protein
MKARRVARRKPSRRNVVGVLERRNPIPPGRYWIDALGDPAMDKLNNWLVAHRSTLRLLASEYEKGEAGPFSNPVPSEWALFEVVQPTPLDGLPSFPTVATPGVTSRGDTVQRPDVEQPWDFGGGGGFGGLGVLVLLWLLLKK